MNSNNVFITIPKSITCYCYIVLPAVNLGLDTSPAVGELAHLFRVLGQIHVTLVEVLGDLAVVLHCRGQL